MKSLKQKPATPWTLIILFLILSAGEIVTGFLYYRGQKDNLLKDRTQELSAITDMKVRQISEWRRERMSDGITISENISLKRHFLQLLTDEDNETLCSDLKRDLRSFVDSYDYRSAFFIDLDSKVRLFYPDQDTILGDYLLPQLPDNMSKGEIEMTDIHQTGKVSYVHLDLLIPLRRPGPADTSVFGLVVLRIDPEERLFFLVRSWPLVSKTSESYLIRRDGDQIAYLNEPRYSDNSGIIVRRSVKEERNADLLAFRGIRETTNAIDYRGVPVIAAVKKVPEMPWFMVAKVDREEILSSLGIQVRQVLIITFLFLLTTGLLLVGFWWSQRVRFYRSKYEAELEHLALKKMSEEILKESEERFRKIFDEGPFGMLMSGKDFGITRVNSALCEMLGYTEENLLGLTFRDFTHHDYISGDEIALMKLVAGELPVYHTEKQYIRIDGKPMWGSTTVSIIRNNNGEVQFFIAMVEDISSRKIAEAELIAAKEKAEESDKLKTAFLHNVSHEIRTPMNAILGFSALLSEPRLTDTERNQYIDIIFQSGNQLLSIINDIVDLAGIESGQVKINIREININTILREIREQYSYKVKTENVILHLKTTLPDNEAVTMSDGVRLVQILSNLINNAFKFTKQGRIDFGYSLKDDCLEFYVKDTGIGIPAEYHSLVFERFYQVDSNVSRQYTGTGLGLSLCKAFVELLGGTIWLNSKPGVGSAFYFTIPYVKCEQNLPVS
jgi:PAS domain S-box-containing protein